MAYAGRAVERLRRPPARLALRFYMLHHVTSYAHTFTLALAIHCPLGARIAPSGANLAPLYDPPMVITGITLDNGK